MDKTPQPEPRAETCANCRFADQLPQIMICRMKPPVPMAALTQVGEGQMAWQNYTAWPIVNTIDWCGCHSPKLQS